MDPADNPRTRGKFRVLMLHGYSQSAQRFQAKTRPLVEEIISSAPHELLSLYTGIEILFADAPRQAHHPVGDAVDGTIQPVDNDSRMWWYGADDAYEYKYLNDALKAVAAFLHDTPVHGIVGFSQGAALAAMVASMLECRTNSEKVDALRAQGLPVDSFLCLPDQEPLKAIVCFSGYRGTMQFYSNLYRWRLDTPSCHVVCTLDTVVAAEKTLGLAKCFRSRQLLYHYGTHYVPRDKRIVKAVVDFLWGSCGWGEIPSTLRRPALSCSIDGLLSCALS